MVLDLNIGFARVPEGAAWLVQMGEDTFMKNSADTDVRTDPDHLLSQGK